MHVFQAFDQPENKSSRETDKLDDMRNHLRDIATTNGEPDMHVLQASDQPENKSLPRDW